LPLTAANLELALEDSISGSASSSDDEGGNSDISDAVHDLLQKTRMITRSRTPSPEGRRPHQEPVIWFHSPPATQIGVYRLAFSVGADQTSYLDELRAMQGGERKWALFMTAGGHFAGAVVRVSRGETSKDEDASEQKRKKPKHPLPETEVLLHKTFHRYTSEQI